MIQPAPSYPWPASMPAPSRAEIEALIEGLIDFLDRQDGDADREADYHTVELDRAGRCCLLGRSTDDEPAMAARVVTDAQFTWAGFDGGRAA